MDVLARCECEGWVGRWPYHGRNDPPDVFRCSDCERIIEEKFVPESHFRGAVSNERALHQVHVAFESQRDGKISQAKAWRAVGDALDRSAGGQ